MTRIASAKIRPVRRHGRRLRPEGLPPREPRPGRLRRFLHVAAYLALGAAAGAGLLTLEFVANGSLLLRPAYKWVTRALPLGVVKGPAGDYAFSTLQARLDWRLLAEYPPGGVEAVELIGYPGMRLAVLELAPDVPQAWSPEEAAARIDAPRAEGGAFLVAPDGTILGDFRLPGKTVRLIFEPDPGARRAPDPEAVAHDVALIARTFRRL